MTHPTYKHTREPILIGHTIRYTTGAERHHGEVIGINPEDIMIDTDGDAIVVTLDHVDGRYWPPINLGIVEITDDLASRIASLQATYGTSKWPDLIGGDGKPEAVVAAHELIQAVAPAILAHIEAGDGR